MPPGKEGFSSTKSYSKTSFTVIRPSDELPTVTRHVCPLAFKDARIRMMSVDKRDVRGDLIDVIDVNKFLYPLRLNSLLVFCITNLGGNSDICK